MGLFHETISCISEFFCNESVVLVLEDRGKVIFLKSPHYQGPQETKSTASIFTHFRLRYQRKGGWCFLSVSVGSF